jgi:uncharacterized protein YndB with AHSA1/START domain
MPQAKHDVLINRPIEDVFAFVADGENGAKWRPGVLDIKRISDDGVGSRYRQGVSGPMGRRVAADYEITAFEPPRRLEFQAIAGPVRPRGRHDFEAVDGGTRVTFSLQAEIAGWKKLLLGSMVAKTMEAEVRSLERLKSVLES